MSRPASSSSRPPAADSTPDADQIAAPATVARPRWGRAWGAAAVVFGLATLKEGGATLLSDDARRAAGHVVPFVLWFNFLAAFAYVAAGVGMWAARRWARPLATALAGATLLVFAALGVHIAKGRSFEQRTVAAMALRSAFWIGAAAFTRRRGGGPSPA